MRASDYRGPKPTRLRRRADAPDSVVALLGVRRLLLEVDLEDRHLELVGELALFLLAKEDADELVADEDLGRVVLLRRARTDSVLVPNTLRR